MTPEDVFKALDVDVIWANSTTGDDFKCVHVDDALALARKIIELESARLQAFEEAAKIAEHNDHIDCMAAKAIASAIRQHAKGEGK